MKETDKTFELGLTRRRVLKATAAMGVAGGIGFGSGIAGAQNGDFDDLCEAVPLDVVLVLDRSGSMSLDPDGDGTTKLEDLQAAATAFVDRLTATDRVGLVSFADAATLDSSLTDDFGSVKTAINGLVATGSTNLPDGVDTGHNEITANGRADATPILVVLSNGIPTVADSETQAQQAKDAGIRVVTIAFGTDADDSLMEAMASEPKSNNFFDAPTGADIDGVFETITQEICPLEVEIDIKPGSDPNAFHCGAPGVVPVGILTTDSFDATTIDPSSLRFGPPAEIVAGCGASIAHVPFPWADHTKDLDSDGDDDVVTHYPIPDTGFLKDDEEGWLVGETMDGRAIAARDSVKIVGNCPEDGLCR